MPGGTPYFFSILATALKNLCEVASLLFEFFKTGRRNFFYPNQQKSCRFQASANMCSSAARVAVRPASINSFER